MALPWYLHHICICRAMAVLKCIAGADSLIRELVLEQNRSHSDVSEAFPHVSWVMEVCKEVLC